MPFIGPAFPNQVNVQPPPPKIVNRDDDEDVEEYEVEVILDSRKRGRTVQYLVKWARYSDLWNLWEDWNDLANTWDKILDFHHTTVSIAHALVCICLGLLYASPRHTYC